MVVRFATHHTEDETAHVRILDELAQAAHVAAVDAGPMHAALQVDHVEKPQDLVWVELH